MAVYLNTLLPDEPDWPVNELLAPANAGGEVQDFHCSEAVIGQRRLRWRDLPDAGGPGFVALDGRFGEANRSLIGRGCGKTKTDLAVNQFCKIQTSKSRRFESRLGFMARFAQFAKVPRVLTQPRPLLAGHGTQIPAEKLTLGDPNLPLVAYMRPLE